MKNFDYTPRIREGNDESFELKGQTNQLNFKGAGFAGKRLEYQIDNFIIYNSFLAINQDLSLHKEISQNWLQFHFQINGFSQTRKILSRRTLDTLPQCLYVEYSPWESCELRFKEKTSYESFGFRMPIEGFLDSFLPHFEELKGLAKAVEKEESYCLTPKGIPLTNAVKNIIMQMKSCPYTGELKRLFMESKITDLVFAMVQQIQEQHQLTTTTFDPTAKIKDAHNFIQTHFNDKLSIKSIAQEVGVNEFALKKGFKEMFGTSVIQYLIDLRLERAYEQMLATDKKLSTIAYETGYSAMSNFSNAFYKKFGFRPSTLRK